IPITPPKFTLFPYTTLFRSAGFKNVKRRTISQQIVGMVSIFADYRHVRLVAHNRANRAAQCVTCFYHVDHVDHNDHVGHYECNKQPNEPTTTPTKTTPAACDRRDPNDEHGSLPNPSHDF